MVRLVLILLIWLLGQMATAQTVPDKVLKRLKSDPEPYLELAANLIHGFGGAQGIDRAGIARFVELQRAAERASGLRKIYEADLNFDDEVTREEMAQLAASASAYARGRLWKQFEAADVDGTGVVSAAEIAGFGKREALRGFTMADEAEAMSVLAFDGDGNGWVELDEVKAAVAALGI